MKKLVRIVLGLSVALVGLVVLVFGAQWFASESGEVVVLYSRDADGGEVATRLWVVDLEGTQYLRAGSDSGWYQRLVAEPGVRLERGDASGSYRAESRPQLVAEINRLMREKYAWRDVYIGWLIGDRDDAIPVALIPSS